MKEHSLVNLFLLLVWFRTCCGIMAVISKCNDGRCQFCTRGSLDQDVNFTSSVTNKKFKVDFDATCTTCCVIYLINCKCCSMQYVGSTFLDLRISIFRGKFRYCSYDKRKDFNFDICNYPHLDGNVPWGPSYGVFLSQLVRFCDINLNSDTFCNDVKLMVDKFIKQGFDTGKLLDTFLKFATRYLFKWSKFGTDISTQLCRIFLP